MTWCWCWSVRVSCAINHIVHKQLLSCIWCGVAGGRWGYTGVYFWDCSRRIPMSTLPISGLHRGTLQSSITNVMISITVARRSQRPMLFKLFVFVSIQGVRSLQKSVFVIHSVKWMKDSFIYFKTLNNIIITLQGQICVLYVNSMH